MSEQEEEERTVKQVIVIRRDLGMRRGKEIAQGAHASMAWLTSRLQPYPGSDNFGIHICALSPAEKAWTEGSFRKIVVQVRSEEELFAVHDAAQAAGLISMLITDSGLTEFHGIPAATAVAVGPDYADLIDPVTGDLKPY